MTLDFYRRNYIEGLFLSSGVMQTPDYTMEQLVAVARQLRETHHFGGYIHLKAMPDASPLLLAAAGPLRRSRQRQHRAADAGGPAPAGAGQIADRDRRRDERELRAGIDEAEAGEARAPQGRRAFAPAGQSTQMIVGATDDHRQRDPADRVGPLHDGSGCAASTTRRTARFPKSDAFLPAKPAPLVREHRLVSGRLAAAVLRLSRRRTDHDRRAEPRHARRSQDGVGGAPSRAVSGRYQHRAARDAAAHSGPGPALGRAHPPRAPAAAGCR